MNDEKEVEEKKREFKRTKDDAEMLVELKESIAWQREKDNPIYQGYL